MTSEHSITHVWIVVEECWDHHSNIDVFASEEAAKSFCKATYGRPDSAGYYTKNGYAYSIEKYEVHE